jgi:hypothetical protein
LRARLQKETPAETAPAEAAMNVVCRAKRPPYDFFFDSI